MAPLLTQETLTLKSLDWKRLWSSARQLPVWLVIMIIFTVSRGLMVVGFWLSTNQAALDFCEAVYKLLANYPVVSGLIYAGNQSNQSFFDLLMTAPTMFDAGYYISIVTDGYYLPQPGQYSNIPFHPWFCISIWAVGQVMQAAGLPFGWDTAMLTGTVIANLYFLGALFCFYQVVRVAASAQVALWAVAFMGFFPSSMHASYVLAESTFLCLVCLFFWAYLTRHRWWAALLSLPLGLSRGDSLFVLAAVLPHQLFERPWQWQRLLQAGLMVLGLLSYQIFLVIKFQRWDAYAWGRHYWTAFISPVIYSPGFVGAHIAVLVVAWATSWLWRKGAARISNPRLATCVRPTLVALWLLPLVVFWSVSVINALGRVPQFIPVVETLKHSLKPLFQVSWAVPENLVMGEMMFLFAIVVLGFWQHCLPGVVRWYALVSLVGIHMAVVSPRHMFRCFPLFWCLALGLARRPIYATLLLGAFALLLVMFSALYVANPNNLFLF